MILNTGKYINVLRENNQEIVPNFKDDLINNFDQYLLN